MSTYVNSYRIIRLQLKTGYMKTEPSQYRFLLKYPPLNRDTAPPVSSIQITNIPYVHLYKKIIANNSVLRDEKVYDSYWYQEPSALTMAKKQYEYMTKGYSEESALQEAKKYVSNLESKAYEGMIDLKKFFKELDAKDTYFSDNNVLMEVRKWRLVLIDKPYEQLDLADQGEIDYFIQTKILKWQEVERERRMKDPVFVFQFEKLREQIFPEIQKQKLYEMRYNRKEFKKLLAEEYNFSLNGLSASAPFYYEDYVMFFNKLKSSPFLVHWNERASENLSRWIIDTLGFQSVLRSSTHREMQSYLNQVRSEFFPMIKYPDDAQSFSLPSIDEIKEILYKNDIGYKVQNKKLFINRFYALPLLLFPKQTWTTKFLQDQEKVKSYMTDKNTLFNEIKLAGFDQETSDHIEKKVKEYTDKYHPGLDLPSYNAPRQTFHSTSLDELIGRNDNLVFREKAKLQLSSDVTEVTPAAPPAVVPDLSATEVKAKDEWTNALNHQNTAFDNLLEKDRYDYLVSLIPDTPALDYRDLDLNDKDLDLIHKHPNFKLKIEPPEEFFSTSSIILAARFEKAYESKEGARRHRDWVKRGVFMNELPKPELRMIDEDA